MGYSVSDAIESITLARGHAIEREQYISYLGRNLELLPKEPSGEDICRGVADGEPPEGGTNRPGIDKGKDHDKRHGPARDNFRGRGAWNAPSSSLPPWEPSHSQKFPESREDNMHHPRRSEFVDESEFQRAQNWGNSRSSHRPGSFQPGLRHDGPLRPYTPEGRHYRDEGRHSDMPGVDPKIPLPLLSGQRGRYNDRRLVQSEFVRDDNWSVDARQEHGSRHNSLHGRHSPSSGWTPPLSRVSPPKGRLMSPQYRQRYSPPPRMSPPRNKGMSPGRRVAPHGSRQLTPPPPPRSFRTPPPPTRSSPPPGHRMSPPRRLMAPRHGSPPRNFRPPSPRGRPMSPPYNHHEQRFQPLHGNRMASPGRRSPPIQKPLIPREGGPPQYFGRPTLLPQRRSSGSPDRFHGRPDHLDKKYGPEIEPFPLERSPPRSMAIEESHRIRRSRSPVRRQVPGRRPPSFLREMPPMRKTSPQMRSVPQQYLSNEASRSERRISPVHEPTGRLGRQQVDRGAPRQGTDWREVRDNKVRPRDASLERGNRPVGDAERNRPLPEGYVPRRHPENYIQNEARSRPLLKAPPENLKRPRPRTPELPAETRRGIRNPPDPMGAPRRGQRMPNLQEDLAVDPRRRGVRTPEPQDRRRGLRTPEPLDELRRRGLRTPVPMDRPRKHELRSPEPPEPKIPRLGSERDEFRRGLRTPEPHGPLERRKSRSPQPRDVPRGQGSFRSAARDDDLRNEPSRSRALRTPDPFDDPRRHGVLRTPEPLEEPRRHGVLRTPEPFDEPRRGGLPRTPDSPGREYRDNRPSGYRGRGNRRPFGNHRGQSGRGGRGFRGGPKRYNDGNIKKPYLDQPQHSPQDTSLEYHDFPEYHRSRSQTPCMMDTPSVMDPFVEEEPDCRELLIEKRISSVTEEMRALSPSALDLINPDDEIIFIGGNSERVDSSTGRRPAASRLSPRLPMRPPLSPPPKKPVFERLDDKKPPVFERLDSLELGSSPTERPSLMNKRPWSSGRGRGRIGLSNRPSTSRPKQTSTEPRNRDSASGTSRGAKSSRGISSPQGLSRGLQPKTGVKKPPGFARAGKAPSPPQSLMARRPPTAIGRVAKAPIKVVRKPLNGSPVKKSRGAPRGRR